MAVTNYSAEYPGVRTDAEAAAEPFGAEPWGAPTDTDTPPVVDNITPASGSQLAPGDAVQFDLTHPDGASALAEFFVLVFSREWECAYDLRSESFGPAFGGTRTAITDGYRFVIFRREGWRFLPGSGLEIYAAPRTTDGATSS